MVLKDGFIQQVSAPQELYEKPVNLFVATFIGSPQMNTLTAILSDEGGHTYASFGKAKLLLPDKIGRKPSVMSYIGKEVILGIRPEDIHDEDLYLREYPQYIFEATVDATELMGAETYLYLLSGDEQFTARVSPSTAARVGDSIKLTVEADKIHLFDADTEKNFSL